MATGPSTFLVDPAEVLAASTGLTALEETLQTVITRTNAILGNIATVWQGTGQAQFDQDMSQWTSGVATVQQSLSEINGLLRQAATAYANVNDSVTSSMAGRG